MLAKIRNFYLLTEGQGINTSGDYQASEGVEEKSIKTRRR
jgi:hypothetical protein